MQVGHGKYIAEITRCNSRCFRYAVRRKRNGLADTLVVGHEPTEDQARESAEAAIKSEITAEVRRTDLHVGDLLHVCDSGVLLEVAGVAGFMVAWHVLGEGRYQNHLFGTNTLFDLISEADKLDDIKTAA